MSINVKFFARLREDLGLSEQTINAAEVKTVIDVWDISTQKQPMPPNILMAVNMEYVDAQHEVKSGDEVAFFPPVTGG